MVDSAVDAVREAATDALNMETNAAEADVDGGIDGGSGTCTCPTLPVPPSYTFSWTANGHPATNVSSTAQFTIRQYPAGSQIFLPGTPEPVTRVTARVVAWMPRGAQTWPSVYAEVSCPIYIDGTGALYPDTNVQCQVIEQDSPTYMPEFVMGHASVVRFTDTQIEFHVDTLPASADGHWPALTNLVFRANDPSAHYTAIGGAYVP